MVSDAAAVGLDVTNLSPRDLPTFWSSALIHVARIRAVIIGGTSPVGKSSAGQVDLLHLEEAASYADVFVTCDRALRSFAATVRGTRCEVLSYNDWAARIVPSRRVCRRRAEDAKRILEGPRFVAEKRRHLAGRRVALVDSSLVAMCRLMRAPAYADSLAGRATRELARRCLI
jgi:hypothetical protein